MDAPGRLLVSLCTYNERENVEYLIPEIRRLLPDADIVVIDDSSPDGTSDVVDGFSKADSRVHLIRRDGKQGLGTATLAAFRFAIDHEYEFLLNLDADYSHPTRFIPALLAAARDVDIVIGSRYVSGGSTPGWSNSRQAMSKAVNAYARLLLRLKTRDNSGAFRVYRVSLLKKLPLERVRARGYAFQEEILFRCREAGATFAEVPIAFEERRYGHTKINWKEAAATLWILACLPWERSARNSLPG